MDLINEFLARTGRKRLCCHVVGDAMLDEYYSVQVTRISPESPAVNVMLSDSDTPSSVLPGGAANVCYQLRNFNADPRLFSWADERAVQELSTAGVVAGASIRLPEGGKLPRKKRFYAGDMQVSDRWDVERLHCGLGTHLREFQQTLSREWAAYRPGPDVVIFSDYDKGTFVGQEFCIPDWCRAPTIVDPKKSPITRWKGCTVFKPNSKEAEQLSGCTSWHLQCDYFRELLGCRSVVITQSGEGVVGWCQKTGYFEHRPVRKVVSNKNMGAGDCFIAILALAVGHHFQIPEAAEIAFEAGALYVQQEMKTPITPWGLQRRSKFVGPEVLKDRDYKLVFTNGCFDAGLTKGHIDSLNFARDQGERLVVALNSDESVRRLKGEGRPVLPLKDRMAIVGALESVDYVVSFEEDSPLRVIEAIRPDVIVKGGDYKPEEVVGYGLAEIRICPYSPSLSTTDKLKKLGEI